MPLKIPAHVERLQPYVPGKPTEELERELGISGAVKLASNENPVGPSPRALRAAEAALASVNRYPDASAFRLRRALAAFHGVPMDDLTVGNGSNELIDLCCRTFAGPGDHAVIGTPSFVCYALGLTAANVPYTEVTLRGLTEWNVDDLLAAVTPSTRLLFVANPNNPTGTIVPRDELRRLITSLPDHVLLVMDEAYVEFADPARFASALEFRELRDELLVLRTFSKAYGLAALRVGYAIGRPETVGYLNRTRAPFNVGTASQEAAIAALADQEFVREYLALNARERGRVEAGLRGLGLAFAPSSTNFVFVHVRQPGSVLFGRMLRRGVIVRPMPKPAEEWVRISVGLPSENERMLDALAAELGTGAGKALSSGTPPASTT